MDREIVWSRLTRLLPAILLGLLLPLMVLLSKDYGVTWDERNRQAYGEKVWQFYAGHVQPDEFLTGPARAHLYGALFDVTAVALQKVLPLDPYVVRHALNSVFGWLGIVGCYVLAARLGGSSAGLLALVLLAVTPRYWGDAMNNPKDLPFATCATAALVVMAGIPARYPFLTIGRALTLGVSIGLALSVRPGGLLFLAYAVVVVAVQIVRSADYAPRHLLATAGLLLVATAVATTVPLPFWPWLQQRPYVGLVEALAGVSNFGWGGTTIFEGADVSPRHLPWTYVPTWLLYTTPLVTVVGVLLAGTTLVRPSRYRVGAWGLLAAALFPVAYVIVKHSTLYDGIRHLLFIVPPIVALAALGWHAGLESRRPVVRLVAIAGSAGGGGRADWLQHPESSQPGGVLQPAGGRPARRRRPVRAGLLGQLSLPGAAACGRDGHPCRHAHHCVRGSVADHDAQPGPDSAAGSHSTRSEATSSRTRAHARTSRGSQQSDREERPRRSDRDHRRRRAVRYRPRPEVRRVGGSSASLTPPAPAWCRARGLWGSMPLTGGFG